MPALPGDVRGQLTDGYICACSSTDFEYVADHWRRGVVLDCFGGSGTTAAVAEGHSRDSILIDLDERNAELAEKRCGMFMTVEYPDREGAA